MTTSWLSIEDDLSSFNTPVSLLTFKVFRCLPSQTTTPTVTRTTNRTRRRKFEQRLPQLLVAVCLFEGLIVRYALPTPIKSCSCYCWNLFRPDPWHVAWNRPFRNANNQHGMNIRFRSLWHLNSSAPTPSSETESGIVSWLNPLHMPICKLRPWRNHFLFVQKSILGGGWLRRQKDRFYLCWHIFRTSTYMAKLTTGSSFSGRGALKSLSALTKR